MRVFIIAEAGVNHNGSLEIAKKMVDSAKDIGADCIKFQTFVSKNIVSKNAEKAAYQKVQTEVSESQFDMLKRLELSFSEFVELKEYCLRNEIEFLSTAFDIESIHFLDTLGMQRWKIPSGDITNLPYLIEIAKLKKEVILSTGMCTIDEIEDALITLKKYGTNNIVILHCTTEYPAPYAEVNLNVLKRLRERFNVHIGYSDHTKGIEVPIAAVALGATVIEKHFTLDQNMDGPDHKASIEPLEFKNMVTAIRNIELSLGTDIKQPTLSEQKNMIAARKSIIAKKDILKGECLTEENLTVKRPGSGISPMRWFEVVGKIANKDFKEDDLIEL